MGKRRWWYFAGAVAVTLAAALGIAGWIAARRFEPFVLAQAQQYLEQRFGAGAKLTGVKISVVWPTRTLKVSGQGLTIPFKDRTDLPPMISVRQFFFTAPVNALWAERRIDKVDLKGLEINIPPKAERDAAKTPAAPPLPGTAAAPSGPARTVLVDKIIADGTILRIYPKDSEKPAREFTIHHLTLTGAGTGQPLKYDATLTNPAPKGVILSKGTFGPWHKEDPGQTHLAGDYEMIDADLGVFKGIAGRLDSTGRFQGVLERIEVDGKTSSNDFRLKVGNPMVLKTEFHSIVDGTSGDTYLEPVKATLGSTYFTAKGGIVRHPKIKGRSIGLDVVMPRGRVQDLLRLTMKSKTPMMAGDIVFRARLDIPPGDVDVVDKMRLAGNFEIDDAKFSTDTVQDKLDDLSRRAQGQPKNLEIDDVLTGMAGKFRLGDAVANFTDLRFNVPGAVIQMAGNYGLESEKIDFKGTARLQAKVSQTMSGWKRWALKPADPFFSKGGAGTLLPIKIVGTREKPEFGLNREKDSRARTQ